MRGAAIRNGADNSGRVRLDERNDAGFSATVQAIGTLCSLPRRSFSNFLTRQTQTANRTLDYPGHPKNSGL